MGLVLSEVDTSTIESAGALVARQQAVTRQGCPALPAAYCHVEVCTAALRRLLDAGARGIVATDRGRAVAVMTAIVRDVAAVGRYVRLPAEGFAVDEGLDDPTTALATVYAALAEPLVTAGVRRHYLLHVAEPRLFDALANLGFGRVSVYGVRSVAPRRPHPNVAVRQAAPADLETIARLALVELRHRAQPPMFGRPHNPPLADLAGEHGALRDSGAVHLIAALGGRDVGLLTVEPGSAVPSLCPADQPYIGPTATMPDVRRQGVGQALVDAALDWAHQQGYAWISVDFEAANPMSRPFWLGAGFHPTGYGLLRLIEQ